MELKLEDVPEECRKCPFLYEMLLSGLKRKLELTDKQVTLLDGVVRELNLMLKDSPHECSSHHKDCSKH